MEVGSAWGEPFALIHIINDYEGPVTQTLRTSVRTIVQRVKCHRLIIRSRLLSSESHRLGLSLPSPCSSSPFGQYMQYLVSQLSRVKACLVSLDTYLYHHLELLVPPRKSACRLPRTRRAWNDVPEDGFI